MSENLENFRKNKNNSEILFFRRKKLNILKFPDSRNGNAHYVVRKKTLRLSRCYYAVDCSVITENFLIGIAINTGSANSCSALCAFSVGTCRFFTLVLAYTYRAVGAHLAILCFALLTAIKLAAIALTNKMFIIL